MTAAAVAPVPGGQHPLVTGPQHLAPDLGNGQVEVRLAPPRPLLPAGQRGVVTHVGEQGAAPGPELQTLVGPLAAVVPLITGQGVGGGEAGNKQRGLHVVHIWIDCMIVYLLYTLDPMDAL